ncbi:unnamed protein product [Schistosoma rodhaini]|nr:unnamed protein product [Schistosoma rodhaini]
MMFNNLCLLFFLHLYIYMNVLIVTVQASVQNNIDSKQKSIIRKWKENKKYIESMIESFEDAERKIEDFTDQLKETRDEYEQVDEYIKCSNERLEVQNRLKLLTEIYLNKSKILKDCFNSELLDIEKRISDYPEENCLEFIPHNNTIENKYLSEIAKELSHQSKTLGTGTQKQGNLLEESTTTLTSSTINEQTLSQKVKPANKGNFYLIYLVIIILSAIFITGAVYILCTHSKFVRFNLK